MKIFIQNRDVKQPAGGWIHLVPKGELLNSQAGIVQVLDDEALNSILANIQKEKNRLGDKWPGIYAGREHFIYNGEQDSEALAWFKDFEKRDDGIWGADNGLTDIGMDAIKNRRYKFTSFVADRGDLKKIDGNRFRVMKIETIGFTNHANGKELLTPISNRPGATVAVPRHHRFNSDEEWLAAREKNLQVGAANIEAAKTASERSDAAHMGEAVDFSWPDLEKWFCAVANVQKIAYTHGSVELPFSDAWNLAKDKFPEIYQAAFGTAEQSPETDDADTETAAAQVASLANRISNAAGCSDLRFGWNFVRGKFPALFNRASARSETVLNRETEKQQPQAIQKKAADLFSQIAFAEQKKSSLSHSQAWQYVTNRHPALVGLASGSLTLEEACAREPGLRERLA